MKVSIYRREQSQSVIEVGHYAHHTEFVFESLDRTERCQEAVL